MQYILQDLLKLPLKDRLELIEIAIGSLNTRKVDQVEQIISNHPVINKAVAQQ